MKKCCVFILMVCIACVLGCVKPFAPPATTTNYNYLVVEGMINLTDSTVIHLSRTVTLPTANTTKNELKATVTIESSAGATYPLKEIGNGLYVATPLNLSATNQYRLRIKTTGGATYLSDFAASMISPAIDSISWQAADNLNIYVTTHDPKNATHYYRWDYSEQWEFLTDFDSGYVSNGLDIVVRTPAQFVHHCYGGDTSHLINLGTSEKLSQDVINQQIINTVPASIEKLGVKYSIQIKQYALTKDAYDYWTLLKKNTENLGSIFDSQPSASIGNIHNINNAAEAVIGYMSAGTITNKRIFIAKSQLPANYVAKPAYPIGPGQCELDTVSYAIGGRTAGSIVEYPQFEHMDYLRQQFLGKAYQLIPVSPTGAGNTINGVFYPQYNGAMPLCVDCTLRGSANKPSYWQ